MSEWQTIESAPKDGSQFLAYDSVGFTTVCWWDGGEICAAWDGTVFTDATHWMPLPEPPK